MPRDSNINELQPWLQAYIDRLSPAARKKMALRIGREITRANRRRMMAQQSPDGQAWEKRKPQSRLSDKDNRRKLFIKLHGAKNLRQKVSDSRIIVGFEGSAGRIARIHHYGLKQRLKYGEASYAARELVGITDNDQRVAGKVVIKHIQGRQ